MRPVLQRIIIISGIFIVAAVLTGYILFKTYTGFNEQLLQRTALLLGEAVEETLRNAADQNLEKLTNSEKKRLRQLMNSMTTDTGNIIHILLINSQMTILLSSDRSIEGHQYKSAEELARLQSDQPQVLKKTWEGDFRIMDVIIPLKNNEEQLYGHLRMVLSYEGLSTTFKDLSRVFGPLLIVFSALLMLSAYFLSKSYSKPLNALRQAAKDFKTENPKPIKYKRKDEFTDTFMQLNKSIEKASFMTKSNKKIQRHISALLHALHECIVLIDAEGKITSVNVAAKKLLRCPADKEFEPYFEKILADNKDLKKVITAAIRNQKEENGRDATIILPNEEYLLIRLSTQIFRETGEVNGILLTLKDVHLLNELELNLQRSMQFGVMANLASSISHEIRTPLSSMGIHTEIIRTRLEKKGLKQEDSAYQSLSILQNELKRFHSIVDQFINLARSRKIKLEQIQINDVIRNVLILVQQQAIERNIIIKTEFSDSLDLIYGDHDQLKQVILNIIINGFQAIDSGGTVTIRTRKTGSRIFVEIQDTGKGMPREVQDRLFELYYSTKPGGGGIGLAISKNIMEAHEGRIKFESVEGKGTRFTLDFPKRELTKTHSLFVKSKTKR